MKTENTDILIIGGGLTGLTIAYLLRTHNLTIKIIEARERLGGRIHTVYNEKTAPVEMGATWLGKKHTILVQLLKELNIGMYKQLMGNKAIYEADGKGATQFIPIPPNPDPSYRIEGGSSNLINILVSYLEKEQIHTSQTVKSIEKEEGIFSVKTENQQYHAKVIVSTLPPYLLTNSIKIDPVLPKELLGIANQTHTWMGESIKVGLTYATPFWREKRGTGTVFSNAGPINEMYDHSSQADTQYGLKGFMNGAYYTASKEQRLRAILRQLQQYFGEKIHDYLSYEETIWRKESATSMPYEGYILPHQNNGHSIYTKSYFDGRFFVAGSETARQYPGYMDGAVRSAYFVSQEIDKIVAVLK